MRRPGLRALIALLAASALTVPSSAAFAQSPYPGPGAAGSSYRYEDYMRTAVDAPFPSDIGDEGWKYTSKSACQYYGDGDQHCTPRTRLNEQIPQELFNVMGASVDRAWETTTGRPDVVIGNVDSGIEWMNPGAITDLDNKFFLNAGELPEPNWGLRDPAHPYDRDGNGQFDMRDYCPVWSQPATCGSVLPTASDSRVRGQDLNANGFIDPEDLIFLFSDGVDTDLDGYKDNISGWDTYEDDNDPFDEFDYGHGTGEARDSTAEPNNGGDVGTCPNCRIMVLRVGDSFIADVNNFAKAVVFATDTGATLIQSALGTMNNSRFAQQAIDYAYKRGVALIASAADESAGHHNQPSAMEHASVLNAIGEPEVDTISRNFPDQVPLGGNGISASGSYLQFRGCTNYGAYITASVPANSCSSEAVGRSAGMAGLAYAAAANAVALAGRTPAASTVKSYGVLDGPGGVPASRALSAEEIHQLISMTADDIDNTARELDVDWPDTQRYPATSGWDPFFGYGRINANKMVKAVMADEIPPEAYIDSPKWYATVGSTAPIQVLGTVAARRYADKGYDVALQWAPWSWRDVNRAPSYTANGVTLAPGVTGHQTAPYSGLVATIDPAAVKAAMQQADTSGRSVPADPNDPGLAAVWTGPAVDPATGRGDHENRQIPDKFGIILRLTVTAKNAADKTLTGVSTKNFNMHDDPALLSGFPVDLQGDGAAAPRFADLNDDGKDELVVATSNGEVHAYESDGTELAGWPVHTTPLTNAVAPNTGGYASGEITMPLYSATLRPPAIGDLDRDGHLEIVVPDFAGRVTVFDRFGTKLREMRTNPMYSSPQPADRAAGFYETQHPELLAACSVPDGSPAAARCIGRHPDDVPELVNRRTLSNRTAWWIVASPTLSDIDPDFPGLEIVAGAADRHAYAWHLDGTPVAGWPVMLRDPSLVTSVNPRTHEIVDGSGHPKNGAKIVTSPSIGDLDGDGIPEIVLAPNEQYEETPDSDDTATQNQAVATLLQGGNDRLYAIHHDGAAHPGAGGTPVPPSTNGYPNPGAFLPGWPAKLSTVFIELLPVVGDGPTGSAVIGNMDGGDDLEVADYGTAGPIHLLKSTGEPMLDRDDQGRQRTLQTAITGADSNSPDKPSIPAAGGGILTDLDQDGFLDVAAGSVGVGKALDLLLPDDQLTSDNHLGVWSTDPSSNTHGQLPAFPREENDLHFLSTPSSADVDGDGLEELLDGTAYSDLHAINYLGEEPGMHSLDPAGWPKFTGGWTVVAPGVGDPFGNGTRVVASTTREGNLFAWNTTAAACDLASWPEWGHDGWNTGNATVDAVRPARISDLSALVNGTGATLAFTAVGDDGKCGQAAKYDVRTSATPITDANWATATPVTTVPAPSPAGSRESLQVAVPATSRYVGIKVLDAATETAAHPANPSALATALIFGAGGPVPPGPGPVPAPTVTPTPTPVGPPTGGSSPTPSASASPSTTPSATGTPTAQPTQTPNPTPAPSASNGSAPGGPFHRVTPARILDTRQDGGPVANGADRLVTVTGVGGVPSSGVTAVVVNTTVTGATAPMDLQVYPAGNRPARRTSNLNAGRGQTVANLVTTAVGTDGRIGLSVSAGASNVILDVVGWFGGTSGDGYVGQTPDRKFDSRTTGAVRAGQDQTVPLFGTSPPTGVSSAVVSVTALGSTGNADVSLWAPGDQPARRTSTLNLRNGDTVANLAVVPVDSSGRVVVSASSGSVHVVLDLLGYFTSTSSHRLEPLQPARIYDTRDGAGAVSAGADRDVQVAGVGGVPSTGVDSVWVNVTSTGSSSTADLQVYPTGSRPERRTSNLNVRASQTVPVLVLAKLGRDGKVSLSTSAGSMHVILDVVGWVRDTA